MNEQMKSVLQTLLAGIGGFIAAKGWISAEVWGWISGGALTILGALWAMWTSRPAGIAGATQALPGVDVVVTPAASPAVASAVAAAK